MLPLHMIQHFERSLAASPQTSLRRRVSKARPSALQPLAGVIVPSCRVRAAIIPVNEKSLLTMSKSKPTAPQAKKIENRQQGETNPETAASAFERASVIRNEIEDEHGIMLKWWHTEICRKDTAAALLLAAIISIYEEDLARISGTEVEVDTYYLSFLTCSKHDPRKIMSALNKLQSLGLIDVRQIPETERLARDGIRAAFGTSAEGIESAKRYLQMMGPALGIRLEVNLVEQRVEEACEFKVPRRKRLLLPGKSSRGARSGTPKPATCPMVIGDDGQKSRVEGKFAVKGAQR